ncbi:DUF2848 domain-containing protein [Alicyclobacillus tolerans]|uniref:DUF2848 family protein n=1 Tax=Alicyclobacillus tolerans TaxID=90970 RepID=UPI001F254FB2|nr:DUF2848 family protein [Alicyclobacillus tolerans]MCF8563168.1 DUF2848 domain-containing protein [Alicyclobacillus tolerans]
MVKLSFEVMEQGQIAFPVESVICVGYSGRNRDAVMKHIHELKELGVPEPNEVPTIFPVSNNSVTQASNIQVVGDTTSGEVEFVLLISGDETFVTVGSDHTDRSFETVSIPHSKQLCAKPLANQVWELGSVMDHWDEISLTCEIWNGDAWEVYQNGRVSGILDVDSILSFAHERQRIDPRGTVVFCGTVPIHSGKFRYADAYRLTISDPVLNRAIVHEYNVDNIA